MLFLFDIYTFNIIQPPKHYYPRTKQINDVCKRFFDYILHKLICQSFFNKDFCKIKLPFSGRYPCPNRLTRRRATYYSYTFKIKAKPAELYIPIWFGGRYLCCAFTRQVAINTANTCSSSIYFIARQLESVMCRMKRL